MPNLSTPESQIYPVRQALNLELDVPVSGYFVYADGAYPQHFLDAIDGLGDIAEEGIIGILPSETNYTSPEGGTLLSKITDSTVALNGLLTFGASGVAYNGASHLYITARELGIPFCVAVRPREYMHRSRELDWLHLQKDRLSPLHALHGSMSLADEGKKVTLHT